MSSENVRVRFVPADGGQPIGEADLPPDRLPESFATATTLQLGGASWQVVRAEPMTRAECARSGRLTLVVRKVELERMAPQDLRYSLPTINDFLPAVQPGSTKLKKHVLELHEDDWRQVEFVAQELRPVVDHELEPIRKILVNRSGVGFTQIHVRTQPKSPMTERHLTLAAVARALAAARAYDGVAYRDGAGLVADGFAFDCETSRVYGLAPDGIVSTLALQRDKGAALPPLAALAREHALMLVDWCAAQVLEP